MGGEVSRGRRWGWGGVVLQVQGVVVQKGAGGGIELESGGFAAACGVVECQQLLDTFEAGVALVLLEEPVAHDTALEGGVAGGEGGKVETSGCGATVEFVLCQLIQEFIL